ncbi:MAG TPA: hypothetical protein VEF34_00155 [Syntrophobacteraceae bacterium]|nr:hypothetical protein [Syntrophobacteraceae bacterium]
MEVIDSHTHWGPSVSLGISVTTAEILRQAEQSGVDRIVIFPFPSQALADEGINEELLNEARYVPRFVPLVRAIFCRPQMAQNVSFEDCCSARPNKATIFSYPW